MHEFENNLWAKLEGRLRLDTLLADFSARFINELVIYPFPVHKLSGVQTMSFRSTASSSKRI
jgi:hypothetical protein